MISERGNSREFQISVLPTLLCLPSVMKVLGATILVLLCTMALCSDDEERMNTASTCCFSYVSRPIPLRHVVNYFRTSDQCPQHGVVFLTKKGRYFCANPHDAWVQEYISHMENL